MRFKLGMLLGLGTTAAVAAVVAGCTASTPNSSTPLTTTSVEQYVERGKYLADIGECISCHSPIGQQGPDMSKMGEGGNAWMTPPLGIGVSPNLTPYEGSKVKTLEAADLAEYWAERTSVKLPNGAYAPKLLPPMPALAKYDKEDLKAIAYFFKSLQGKTPTNPELKSFYFLEAAASESMKTKWPYPKNAQNGSQGAEVPGSFEAAPNMTLDQATINQLIDAASASAGAGH
ncbi:hypothetical protein J7643_16430 [bacterium]|nr:hypothetical protein [bacterium]